MEVSDHCDNDGKEQFIDVLDEYDNSGKDGSLWKPEIIMIMVVRNSLWTSGTLIIMVVRMVVYGGILNFLYFSI